MPSTLCLSDNKIPVSYNIVTTGGWSARHWSSCYASVFRWEGLGPGSHVDATWYITHTLTPLQTRYPSPHGSSTPNSTGQCAIPHFRRWCVAWCIVQLGGTWSFHRNARTRDFPAGLENVTRWSVLFTLSASGFNVLADRCICYHAILPCYSLKKSNTIEWMFFCWPYIQFRALVTTSTWHCCRSLICN